MSMIPRCVVCDDKLPNPYAPGTHCDRCRRPCDVCGGMIQNCRHSLPQVPVPYDRMHWNIDGDSGSLAA